VPSLVIRSASQAGTRPPCSGKSAVPERFMEGLYIVQPLEISRCGYRDWLKPGFCAIQGLLGRLRYRNRRTKVSAAIMRTPVEKLTSTLARLCLINSPKTA